MKYNIFESFYDDGGDSKAKAFFQKMRKFIDNARNSEALAQLKSIFLRNPLAKTCLVEGSNSAGAWSDEGLLLESSGFARSLFGEEKSSLESQFDEALGDYKRPGGSAGTRDMTEAEIDQALGIGKKKSDPSIDEAIKAAFL